MDFCSPLFPVVPDPQEQQLTLTPQGILASSHYNVLRFECGYRQQQLNSAGIITASGESASRIQGEVNK